MNTCTECGHEVFYNITHTGCYLVANKYRTKVNDLTEINEKALKLLGHLFDLYVNGIPCYEDPYDCDTHIGYAILLDSDICSQITDILNKYNSRKCTNE